MSLIRFESSFSEAIERLCCGDAAAGFKVKIAHGIINAISWGILLPLGAFSARYLRHIQSMGPSWFYAHAGVQLSGFFLGTVGFAIGIKLGEMSPGVVYGLHRKLGFGAFCLGGLQTLALLFRPKTTNKFRKYWKSYHHFVGYACVVLGVVNVFQGFEVMGSSRSYAKLAYCLSLATLIGICIASEVNSWVIFCRKAKEETMRREGLIGGSEKGSGRMANMLSNTHVVAHLPKPKPDSLVQKGELVRDFGACRKETMLGNNESFIGSLEVYIHQARDIHNICIYHKQDVYAKFCLTSDPDAKVSTQIINGGGKNPVFNEGIQINVQKIDSSLRCEIWMLSRIRNYLEDQLLGFALVPISDVLIGNGKLAHEFPLSSTELFHTPAGFVQLSLTYTGASPEATTHPVVSVNIEAEEKVVQQEIVDMYLKSMQQFTESLAKMKLPMDLKNESHNSENSSMDENLPAVKDNSPRVFYGSRAFF
ncbi:unnamed protein product, partial [Vitis vinifera]